MITGSVTSHREATIHLIVVAADGTEESVEAIIDTGFSGFVALPPDVIKRLGFEYLETIIGRVADGGWADFRVMDGTVLWNGTLRDIPVIEASSALVGVAMLWGSAVTLHWEEEGSVTISPLAG